MTCHGLFKCNVTAYIKKISIDRELFIVSHGLVTAHTIESHTNPSPNVDDLKQKNRNFTDEIESFVSVTILK